MIKILNMGRPLKEKKEIIGTIDKIFKKQDKNGKDYLIIRLFPEKKSEESTLIFCFGLREKWTELNEEGKYEFEVWKSNQETNILSDFSKIYGDDMLDDLFLKN